MNRISQLMIVGVLAFSLSSCDTTGHHADIKSVSPPETLGSMSFSSDPAPTNRYFPLIVGMTQTYEALTEEGLETTIIEVTPEKRTVQGVKTTVVLEQGFIDGELTEETEILYAQDTNGTVWYIGEVEKSIEDGKVVAKEFSWQAGLEGARAGVMMWARPKLGSTYYQEYVPGEAEDLIEIVSINEEITVRQTSYQNCIMTSERTILEPDVHELKYYCPNVGHVLTIDDKVTTELTEFIL